MGDRDWMHESRGSKPSTERLARRLANAKWLSGEKFVRVVVVIVILGVIAVLVAARWG